MYGMCLLQASGEAEYVETMPAPPGELYAQFVLSTVANGKIANIDASQALVSLAALFNIT